MLKMKYKYLCIDYTICPPHRTKLLFCSVYDKSFSKKLFDIFMTKSKSKSTHNLHIIITYLEIIGK